MLCDICHKNEAVLFLEQVSLSGKIKVNLCMNCSVKYGLSPDPKAVEKSLGSLFSDLAKKSNLLAEDKSRLCPVCGQNLADIKRYGLTGCPECYSIFKNEIKDFLKNSGAKVNYTGSMPSRLRSFRSRLTDRMDLQAKLEDSIKTENYEKAAMYRDFLRALENQSVADGSDGVSDEDKLNG